MAVDRVVVGDFIETQIRNSIIGLDIDLVSTIDLRRCLVRQLERVAEGDLNRWFSALAGLLQDDSQLELTLQALTPWRKGPFQLGNVFLDAEWDCRLKWQRLLASGVKFKDKRILDVGCGNGYFLFQLAQLQPLVVVGLDPTILFLFQFLVAQHYYQADAVVMLPLGYQDLSELLMVPDLLICMGVLYHHRDGMGLLRRLWEALPVGGELVLETLVLDAVGDDILVPQGRYANMRNVYQIPTITSLVSQLRESQFRDIRVLDVTKTMVQEQRVTQWSSSKSLVHFLDPDDETLTLEGYPAPVRAMVVCCK